MAASGTRTQKIIMQQIEEFRASQAKLKNHSSPTTSQQLQPSPPLHEATMIGHRQTDSAANSNGHQSLKPQSTTQIGELSQAKAEQHVQPAPAQHSQLHEAEPAQMRSISMGTCNGIALPVNAAASSQNGSIQHTAQQQISPAAAASGAAQPPLPLPSVPSPVQGSPVGQACLPLLQESQTQPHQPASALLVQEPVQHQLQSSHQVSQQQHQQHSAVGVAGARQEPSQAGLAKITGSQQALEPARLIDPVMALQGLRQAVQAAGARPTLSFCLRFCKMFACRLRHPWTSTD